MKFITLTSAAKSARTSRVNPQNIVCLTEADEAYKEEVKEYGAICSTVVTFNYGESLGVRETVEEIERLCAEV